MADPTASNSAVARAPSAPSASSAQSAQGAHNVSGAPSVQGAKKKNPQMNAQSLSAANSEPPGTPVPGPGRGRPGYTRDDVIARAVAAFNDHGYEATSMGLLAKSLGVSKSALYHHVSSKEEILVEATDRALRGLGAVIDMATMTRGPAIEQLEAMVEGSVRVLCENPECVTLLLRLRGNTDVELELLHRRRALTRQSEEIVRRAQEEGSVRTDLNAGSISRLMFGMINSIVEWYRPGGPHGPEDLAKTVPAIIFDGVRA